MLAECAVAHENDVGVGGLLLGGGAAAVVPAMVIADRDEGTLIQVVKGKSFFGAAGHERKYYPGSRGKSRRRPI